jgi:hypothetical protein
MACHSVGIYTVVLLSPLSFSATMRVPPPGYTFGAWACAISGTSRGNTVLITYPAGRKAIIAHPAYFLNKLTKEIYRAVLQCMNDSDYPGMAMITVWFIP